MASSLRTLLSELKRHLEGWNILIGSGTRIRMVTHLDVDAGNEGGAS